MATTAFDEEFQRLSNLPAVLLHEFSEHDEFTSAINKLRRKSAQYVAAQMDSIDEDGERFMLSRSTDQSQYQPVKDMMRILKDQLTELFDFVDSGGNMKAALDISVTLDRFGRFINAIRLSSVPGKEDSGTSINHLRNRHLFTECNFFLENLTTIFGAYMDFLIDSRSTNPRNLSKMISRVQLQKWIEPTHGVIERLIEMFDQSSLKMFQDEWISFVGIIRNVIEQSTREMNLPEVINNPQKQLVRRQLDGFILVLKLSRLLMNKLYKFTNQKPYLGSRMCFDQLEKTQTEMCYMINSLMSLFQIVKIPNQPLEPIDGDVLKELIESIDETCKSVKNHLESLHDPHTVTLLHWLDTWRVSYNLAIQRTISG